ncbi:MULTISPECIES: hypothetical protein [Ramlibacter]|uniref:Uncharacterized protein n=1 Tax=Ramlibacter pinisoli TaxID=2682844 RepID=A0A6N8IZG3_9BURK|nr:MULTISPECIES: hypothetical protein [Ramlibacter]MBA2962042.1 hypothetical protein [Ramlibacter sp. CGMCC 1.13660]MVQ31985.1 hypothetical protein [Ramlibacter pinisoli]
MSFGALFTLRPRARKARPESADDPFPPTAGWNERRAPAPPDPDPATPRRRAGDRPPRGAGPR